MAPILYRRQRQILDYIRQYIESEGVAPTLVEIAEAMKLSSLATVHEHLVALENKGMIKRTSGKVRGMEVTNHDLDYAATNSIEVPILGYIAAGQPLEPFHDPNATMYVAPAFVGEKKNVFVLQVRGDSMIEEQIRDGDYVVVEHAETAKNGEIVVALLENGMATLKRFFKEATRIRLQPANAKMSPIFVKNVSIQGKVIGLIRQYAN